jgi:predicted lipoprotein with Yx(FWY)xxD motif
MKRLIARSARPLAIGLAVLFALILAACSPAAAGLTPQPVLPDTGGGTVQVADHPEFGPILVTPGGMTLYTNTVDTPDDLRCTNIACTGIWPPFTIDGEPVAGEDIPGSLGTVARPEGSTQVTYDGQPLYTFYLDNQAGDAKGDGFTDFGGTWHVIPVEGSGG